MTQHRDMKHRDIKLLVMDVDGVMTNGQVTYSSEGHELKSFNIKDGVGIKRVQAAGIDTAIITGRVSAMVERRATELQVGHLIQGREDKLTALIKLLDALEIDISRVAYIGDDLPDLDAIKAAGLGACPADAAREVLAASDWVSALSGGTGCVRDLCDYLLDCSAS